MQSNSFLTPNNNFQLFSLEHGLVMLFFAVLGFILIRWALKQSTQRQDQVGIMLSIILILTNIIWIGLQIWVKDFNYKEDLPFHLCNVVGILTIFLALTKKQWIFEVLFFWVMSAVLLAMVTPGIMDSFPHYHFIKYWLTHAGVVIFMLYATFVYGMRLTIKSVLKSFIAIQIYALSVYMINRLLGSNYFYLNAKPPIDSLLDAFGDWPQYLIVIELMLLPLFLLIYSPFYFAEKRKKRPK